MILKKALKEEKETSVTKNRQESILRRNLGGKGKIPHDFLVNSYWKCHGNYLWSRTEDTAVLVEMMAVISE